MRSTASLELPYALTGAAGMSSCMGTVVGLAVDRAGGGEDQPADLGVAHRVEQVERADVVAAVVALGMGDGLGDERERGEVQDAVEAVGERVAHGGLVEQVDLGQLRALGHRLAVAAGEASRTVTSWPASSSCYATTLPMYPAPPVTRSFMGAA